MFSFILFVVFLKIIVFILLKNNFINVSLGGSSDADYYHAYAIGYVDVAVNVWPIILEFLNQLGLYSRDGVAYFLLFLNLLIIPVLTSKLSGLRFKYDQKYYLYCFLLCLIYPTLFFYAFDIYRDVFMVVSFLLSCLVVKRAFSSASFLGFSFFYIIAIALGFFLFALRPYLGYAFLMALFLWKIELTRKRLITLLLLYFLALFVANYAGVFDRLTEYRSGFEEIEGGLHWVWISRIL